MNNQTRKSMEDYKNKTIGELDNPCEALQIIFNGYTLGEIKVGIDSLVEFGRLYRYIIKYKLLFIIPIAMFSAWFFGWDLQAILKIIK